MILNETLGLGIRILRTTPLQKWWTWRRFNSSPFQAEALTRPCWTLVTNGRTRRTQLPNSNTFSSWFSSICRMIIVMIFPRYTDCIWLLFFDRDHPKLEPLSPGRIGFQDPHPRLQCELIASRMRHVRRLFSGSPEKPWGVEDWKVKDPGSLW